MSEPGPACTNARNTFIAAPCLPSSAEKPPQGAGWIQEIKHDGYRMMVRRNGVGVRLFTRNGYDWAHRYPLIQEAARALRASSFLLDGEAVNCNEDGFPDFDSSVTAGMIEPSYMHLTS